MIEDLALELYERQQKLLSNKNKHSYIIKEADSTSLIHWTFGIAVFGAINYNSLSNICISMGENVLRSLKIKYTTEQSIHVGWFILCSYFKLKVFRYSRESANKKQRKWKKTYRLFINDYDKVMEVYENMFSDEESNSKSSTMLPNIKPEVWDNPVSETGLGVVKSIAPEKLYSFDNKHLFKTLNKCNEVGWKINKEVFEVYKYYLACPIDENNKDNNPFKHKRMDPKTKRDRQVQQSHEIRSVIINQIADMNKDRTFYHLYNLDFRARIYPNTQFLNEQSNESARALLQFATGEPIGDGVDKFMIYGSQCYGSEMDTTDERISELKAMAPEIMAIAEDPYTNTSWFNADKPFCWLAWCFEFKRYQKYPSRGSHFPIYCDGSCNGSQHLSALSLDKTIGSLVNLTPTERPEDLYSYVAEVLWKELEILENKISKEDKEEFYEIWETIIGMKNKYSELLEDGKTEEAEELRQELEEYKVNTKPKREKLFPVYWNMIKDPVLRRKVVKRPAMTIGYAATPYGFGKQIYEDTRGLSEHLDNIDPMWAFKLGRLLHTTCHKYLKGPAELLRLFKFIAEVYNGNDTCVSWHVPVTNFHVTQAYYKYKSKVAHLLYGKKYVKLNYRVINKNKVDNRRQTNGTPPNLVHSLDAAHMSMVINSAPFSVACVHDSFGCHAANANRLHKIIREEFINLYKIDPLSKLMKELNITSFDLMPKTGNLNIEEIRDAEFAFY